jgi:retron-type reverse transcriptase
MKRYGNLWKRIISWENLLGAATKAQRGKRTRPVVQHFNFGQEKHLLRLAHDLEGGTYHPGKYRSHWIVIPKPRMISAAPYRDRVVHHALMNILEPILDRHFHPHSFACRKEKGTHAAADRLQFLMKRNRYVLKCDIRKFFPSIDHEILKGTFRRLIKDKKVLSLMDRIVDNSNEQEETLAWYEGDDLFSPLTRRHGLPIGNLTSQWFANWMLNDLDHFITSRLGLGGYVRYCDDFVILARERSELKDAIIEIWKFLCLRRLQVHENRLSVTPVKSGMTFVGYRIWPPHRLVRKGNIKRFRRRVQWMKNAYLEGRIGWEDIKPRLDSWLGHAKQADSERLISRLSRDWTFTRDGTVNVPCCAGRVVEQQCQQLSPLESQQQHARQPEQQYRVPYFPALLDGKRPDTQNSQTYGLGERGTKSPGSVPESEKSVMISPAEFSLTPDRMNRPFAENPIWLKKKTPKE